MLSAYHNDFPRHIMPVIRVAKGGNPIGTIRDVFLINAMLAGNMMANFIGWRTADELGSLMVAETALSQNPSFYPVRAVFVISGFTLGFFATLRYERPIRQCFKAFRHKTEITESQLATARRRLLNEPFFIMFLDIIIWFLAAVAFTNAAASSSETHHLVYGMVLRSLVTGLITVTLAFFWVEHIIQHRMSRYFFPNGGQAREKGVLRVRTGFRLAALGMAISIVPLGAIHLTINGSSQALKSGVPAGEILERLSAIVILETASFAILAIWLIILVKINITRPIKEIIRVLRAISGGNLDEKVKVVSNDEIGYTGDIINEMTEGLKERNLMRERLTLAMQVQRRLLPKAVPTFPGLDIAGKSVYCEETGGDYYDFIVTDNALGKCLSVLVGDVSGHGISSALLMATGRAFLRLQGRQTTSLSSMVEEVNREMVRDLDDSGQFMTLFAMTVSPENRSINWVRAGHDPAILYDHHKNAFEELKGAGTALGVLDGVLFEENTRKGPYPGQIIVVGTDGIWETRNCDGKMFGKNRLFSIIREHADKSAKEILNSTFDALSEFLDKAPAEDDITLVVVKAIE